MKYIILLLFSLLVVGCGKKAVDIESLTERDGLLYELDKAVPYSGPAKKVFTSGDTQASGELKGGRLHGLWTKWHENGQKAAEESYKDGKKHGMHRNWFKNGVKEREVIFMEGELDGTATIWREDGSKEMESIHKYGKKVSAKYWNSKGDEISVHEWAAEQTGLIMS